MLINNDLEERLREKQKELANHRQELLQLKGTIESEMLSLNKKHASELGVLEDQVKVS